MSKPDPKFDARIIFDDPETWDDELCVDTLAKVLYKRSLKKKEGRDGRDNGEARRVLEPNESH